MARVECERERELLDVLSSGAWPERSDGELREHVAACGACGELIEVAHALLDDRHAAMSEAHVPGSGLVWFRVRMRAQREGARAASRAITMAQAAALACAVLAAVVILVAMPAADHAWAWVMHLIRLDVDVANLAFLAQWGFPVLLALGAWMLLAPVAAFLAMTED